MLCEHVSWLQEAATAVFFNNDALIVVDKTGCLIHCGRMLLVEVRPKRRSDERDIGNGQCFIFEKVDVGQAMLFEEFSHMFTSELKRTPTIEFMVSEDINDMRECVCSGRQK